MENIGEQNKVKPLVGTQCRQRHGAKGGSVAVAAEQAPHRWSHVDPEIPETFGDGAQFRCQQAITGADLEDALGWSQALQGLRQLWKVNEEASVGRGDSLFGWPEKATQRRS